MHFIRQSALMIGVTALQIEETKRVRGNFCMEGTALYEIPYVLSLNLHENMKLPMHHVVALSCTNRINFPFKPNFSLQTLE